MSSCQCREEEPCHHGPAMLIIRIPGMTSRPERPCLSVLLLLSLIVSRLGGSVLGVGGLWAEGPLHTAEQDSAPAPARLRPTNTPACWLLTRLSGTESSPQVRRPTHRAVQPGISEQLCCPCPADQVTQDRHIVNLYESVYSSYYDCLCLVGS